MSILMKNIRDDAHGGAAASLAKEPRTLTPSKRDEIMNEWALYNAEEVAEGAPSSYIRAGLRKMAAI
ncbi:MAG: hypothetical protein ABJ059_16615 [Hyphomicrobiales bacterium]